MSWNQLGYTFTLAVILSVFWGIGIEEVVLFFFFLLLGTIAFRQMNQIGITRDNLTNQNE